MTPASRIVVAIQQLRLDAQREGMDAHESGREKGLLEALVICVGRSEAARLLNRKEKEK